MHTASAILRRHLNERVRPIAESARSLLYRAADLRSAVDVPVTELAAAGLVSVDEQGVVTPTTGNADTVIDDGRADEGVQPITVGDYCRMLNTLLGLAAQIEADVDLIQSIGRACVRPAELGI